MTDRLIVLPDDTAKSLIDALDGARRSVNIRMFLFTDPDMVQAVKAAESCGVKVHRLKHLKLHGKMLIADEARAIIGSINLAPGSFDERREPAIETAAPEVIERLRAATGKARRRWT